MREFALFAEDLGHEEVVKAVVSRLAREYDTQIHIRSYSARHGYGKVIAELEQYLRDLRNQGAGLPDMLIVATDANCKGYVERRNEIHEVTNKYEMTWLTIAAIPDPHVERWLLLDSAAFRKVLGRGYQAPDQRCERDRYKELLAQAVRDTGRTPLLGGIEHAQDLIDAFDLERVASSDSSFGAFVDDLKAFFKAWLRN